ncbi:MAG TPA: glycosyltransferase [Bacilli bacterium]|nr:glycosyltransferase [Bacilli bacterium]
MKIFILFNHPAPYKIKLFNGISNVHELHVIFERLQNKDRNKLFYDGNEPLFTIHPIKGLKLGNENHFSFGALNHLKKNKYDLIIINGYSTITEMLALRYLKKNNIPYAFYINGGVAKKENRFKHRLKKYFLTGAKFYFSPSEVADKYLLNYGVQQECIRHFPYSTIFEQQIVEQRISAKDKRSFWLDKNIDEKKVFVTVTSFIKRKNNLELIKCWQKLPKDYGLVLIGDGKEKKKYLKFISEHQLNNVHLLPFMKSLDALEFVKNSHGALYLSRYDIYGHVINEALAMGANVMASDKMVATKSLIRDKQNGLVYDYSSSLKDMILSLDQYDFFQEATNTARGNTIEKMVTKHLQIIEENK